MEEHVQTAKASQKRLVILLGWPGVGKTTVGKVLSNRTGFPLLDNHLVYGPITGFLKKGSTEAHSLNCALQEAFLRVLLSSATPGVIITAGIRQRPVTDFMRQVMRMAKHKRVKVDFVKLVCTWKEHIVRIGSASRLGKGKATTIQELKEKIDGPHFSGLPYHPPIEIDNTTLSPTQCANRIIYELGLATR